MRYQKIHFIYQFHSILKHYNAAIRVDTPWWQQSLIILFETHARTYFFHSDLQ